MEKATRSIDARRCGSRLLLQGATRGIVVNHVGQAVLCEKCAGTSPSRVRIYDSSPAKITGDKAYRE